MTPPGLASSDVASPSASRHRWPAMHANGTVCVFVALLAAALAPVLWFSIPMAMVDYPNHLARMFILSRSGGSHPNPFYQLAWALYPNLAMDLLVPPLGRLTGVETAMRLFYLAGQILVVTGSMAIERVVKGRLAIAGFVALMFLYSIPFAWGFVNFEFALGCALWCIACALAVQERGWAVRLALHSVFIAWLFVAHLFALGVYGLTLGLHELWRAWSRKNSAYDAVGRLAMLAIPSLALLAVAIRFGAAVGGTGTKWFFLVKPSFFLRIMNGYSGTVSALSVVSLIVLAWALARNGALRLEKSGAFLATGFTLLYLAMPSKLFDTSFVDIRIIVAAVFVLPAFVSLSFPSPAWRRTALAASAALTILNVAVVLDVWISYRADYAAAKASFAQLPKGAKILIAHSGDGGDPPSDLTEYPMYNVPTLAVHYADAFVPNLFTESGKQPITARAAWKRLDIPYGGPAPIALLKLIAERGAPDGTPGFVRTWPEDFDYMYLLGPPIANPMRALLDEISRAPRFVLYRIRKTAASAASQ